ncbi:MAG: glycosyltransferase family 87 protein [Vicinamibacterales bacterium]
MLWILASVSIALLCYEIPTLISAVLWPLWNNPNALQTDFHYYYEAAQRFSQDRHLLYRLSDDVIAGFAYPPPAIVPFVALARLPLGAALLALTVASYGVLVSAVRQWCAYLRRHGFTVEGRTMAAIMLIALAFGPTYMNAIFGQVNTFVLASAVAFVCLLNVPAAAGSMLALGIWLKIYPAFLAVIALWERRAWRALAWAGAIAALIALVALPLVPLDAYRTFLTGVLPARLDKTAIHITNQSVAAFLERFRQPPEMFLNWTGHEAVTVSGAVRAINALLMVAGVLYFWRRFAVRGSHPSAAAAVIAMVAVVAPLGWGHTYVMVLPLVILRLISMRAAGPPAAAAIVMCVLAFMIPAGRHLPLDWAPGWAQNLVYSRYLIATVVLLVLDLDRRPRRA